MSHKIWLLKYQVHTSINGMVCNTNDYDTALNSYKHESSNTFEVVTLFGYKGGDKFYKGRQSVLKEHYPKTIYDTSIYKGLTK